MEKGKALLEDHPENIFALQLVVKFLMEQSCGRFSSGFPWNRSINAPSSLCSVRVLLVGSGNAFYSLFLKVSYIMG